jgi:primosomal protein N'
MNLITVIPLSRAKVAPTLSYFTAADAPVGAVVSVPLRSKSIHAIIIESRPVEDLKAEIKSAPYEIRKLVKIKANAFFPSSFMEAARTLADYYATNIGNIVNAVVSDAILENANKIPPPLPMQASFISGTPSPDETYAVQGDDNDRISAWRSLIRQEFARKRSLAFYAPTVEDAARLFASLEKGIEGYIFLLHSGLTAKKIVTTWKAAADTNHPIVIVATSSFSLLPRADIETVVIERENARGWISQRAPYIDSRHALETVNRRARRTVYLADCLLCTETLYRVEEKEIASGTPFKWRSISNAKDELVDMKEEARSLELGARRKEIRDKRDDSDADDSNENDSKAEKTGFRILSDELAKMIARVRDESSHLFILTSRRGTAPITVCNDCETIVTCRQCSAPVVLHVPSAPLSNRSGSPANEADLSSRRRAGERQCLPMPREAGSRETLLSPRAAPVERSIENELDGRALTPKNFYMCHKCGERRPADEVCVNCGGWRLTTLGIGIDRVREEILERFPGTAIFKIDADTTRTEAQVSEALTKFKGKPGSILLGTEMALPHISEPIDHIAVASLDSLFALPDYRIEERVMYALVRLRSLAARSILVQTRRAEERVFEFGLKGNLSDFHRSVLDGRKRFGYPPFSTLIKITLEGKKDEIAKNMGEIQALLAPQEVDVFPAFTATVRGLSVIHGLCKIDPHHWPDTELADKLRRLPPSVSMKVDPESLL